MRCSTEDLIEPSRTRRKGINHAIVHGRSGNVNVLWKIESCSPFVFPGQPFCRIYGVIAYVAAQRTGELATRLALGASGRQVFWLMMGAGQCVALAGVVVGLAVAYVGGRLVASRVYAMRASDPLVLFTAGAIVANVTFAATMVPSIKASRLDPAQALRPE